MKIWLLCRRSGPKESLERDLCLMTSNSRTHELWFKIEDPKFRVYSLELDTDVHSVYRGGPDA
jgi:hypothetical protein